MQNIEIFQKNPDKGYFAIPPMERNIKLSLEKMLAVFGRLALGLFTIAHFIYVTTLVIFSILFIAFLSNCLKNIFKNVFFILSISYIYCDKHQVAFPLFIYVFLYFFVNCSFSCCFFPIYFTYILF